MFLPRKLQKRSHAGRRVRADDAVQQPSCEPSIDDAERQRGATEASPSSGRDSVQVPSSVSAIVSAGSNVEAAKLERLVEFLFLRLCPLGIQTADGDELYRSITAAGPPSTVASASQPTTIHLARLLTLIPGLEKRCRSIDLLSQALCSLVSGAASKWFVLHEQRFVVEFLPAYVRFVRDVRRNELSERLVYVESIPPSVGSRVQAAEYVGNRVPGMVAGVLEPSVADGWMDGEGELELGARWGRGRAFFVLDARESVEVLCERYKWDLRGREGGSEPIRCLSWHGWTEMRQTYWAQQNPTPSRDVERKHPTPSPSPNTTWYRGTILLLPLSPPSSPLTLPPTLTPTALNHHLKPQLEQRVRESISYIHARTDTIAIRTAHPALAAQLVAHFDQLEHMPPEQEDAYWSELREKTRNAALRRFCVLEAHIQ